MFGKELAIDYQVQYTDTLYIEELPWLEFYTS